VNVLLVPAHPGFPGQISQSRKTVVCCVLCVCVFRQNGTHWILDLETKIRWHNLSTTAKQVAMVWACVAKRKQ